MSKKSNHPKKERHAKRAQQKNHTHPHTTQHKNTKKSNHSWRESSSMISHVLRPKAIVQLTIVHIDTEMGDVPVALAQMDHGSKKPVHVLNFPHNLEPAQKIMAKVEGKRDGVWNAHFIRIVEEATSGLAVYHQNTQTLNPIHRKYMFDPLPYTADNHLNDGDVVQFQNTAHGLQILMNVGSIESSRVYSQIAAMNQDVWNPIADDEEQACAHFSVPPLSKKRIDLRHIPFVTIDGADAKDFDDAVWATPDTDARNPDGYRIMVAIADVAHYVKPSSLLDTAAQKRGNSVYLPDYVLPMLPERLSNDLCSLRPHCDRACVVVDMVISKHGLLKHTHFKRALMHSQARLTYEQVESMIRAKSPPKKKDDKSLYTSTLKPLYEAFKILRKARDKRGALDIHTTEHQLIFDAQNQINDIKPRKNLTSHALIEEMMVLANTAVAKALKNRDYPCMYRIHPKPDPTRIEGLREFTRALSLPAPSPQKPTPHEFNKLLRATAKTPYASLFNDLVLRCQAQARYSPVNEGHFGLGLMDYAHFTSPIRRYADLMVHRLLLQLFDLDDSTKTPLSVVDMDRIGQHLSNTERQAALAEREAKERFIAAYLAHHIGEEFDALITGVNRRGVYVTIAPIQAEAFMPRRLLTPEGQHSSATSFYYDEAMHSLRVKRRTFQLGMPLTVKLVESSPITGHIIAGYVAGGD